MHVVTCWQCMHVFGQDEDTEAAADIARKTTGTYQNCPSCGKALEISVGWASGAMDNRPSDIKIEVDLDSDDVPDPGQLLKDELARAGITAEPKKKKRWWNF